MADKEKILSNVYEKLQQIPAQLNFTANDIEPSLNDALRQLGIGTIEQIQPNSKTELFVELCTQWWMLHRVRSSVSMYFKYSTGEDGKSVDKTKIPNAIADMMDDIALMISGWNFTAHSGTTGSIWNMTKRESERLK